MARREGGSSDPPGVSAAPRAEGRRLELIALPQVRSRCPFVPLDEDLGAPPSSSQPGTEKPRESQKPSRFYKCNKEDAKLVENAPVILTLPPKKVSDKAVITGGASYLGFTLGCALAKSGTKVILYDFNPPIWDLPKGIILIRSDVRNFSDLYSACEGVDCLIHTASYGMTGIEQLHKKRIRSVNIGGTGIVLEVCKRQRIPRLIYTSTVDVVFAGQTIVDGDEATVSYVPLEQQVNEYSRTKAIAEQMVLAANGSFLPGGGKLYTCAIRPPGIYGPEDLQHLSRLALNWERGFFNVCLGNPGILTNWVHVKNLVQAHILAAKALTPETDYIAGGQAYFINDGEEVNLFEWLSPLFERLGYQKPWVHIPVLLVHLTAAIVEKVQNLLLPLVEITPLITRHEVHNMYVTHTFKIDKAQSQLGYTPKKYSLADCVDHFLKKGPRPRSFFLQKCLLLLVVLTGLVALTMKFTQVRDFLLDSWGKYRHLL
ncbi:putative short-chain dehydrogenase/reductase family 42E member 2 [Pseudonaja textilis]|uniref:putative short-chain dehydrogenase/reductase family 42E member 2 n=1 Tax=Pseudonaja textilis TaxID=8673 RepID=UPI000EA92B39|nr:putative short-chain dehydrogenase/reductase family 42E member 2 [Pseudonaja textilis]